MGLDIAITREELLSQDYEKRETIIKRNVMEMYKGWELGQFLIDAFDIDNSVPKMIDARRDIRTVKLELENLNYQPSVEDTNQDWHDGYVDNLKNMLAVLAEAVNEDQGRLSGSMERTGEWYWELDW